jgi:hypothetical protein
MLMHMGILFIKNCFHFISNVKARSNRTGVDEIWQSGTVTKDILNF